MLIRVFSDMAQRWVDVDFVFTDEEEEERLKCEADQVANSLLFFENGKEVKYGD